MQARMLNAYRWSTRSGQFVMLDFCSPLTAETQRATVLRSGAFNTLLYCTDTALQRSMLNLMHLHP
jgi:hypothetical protein